MVVSALTIGFVHHNSPVKQAEQNPLSLLMGRETEALLFLFGTSLLFHVQF